MRRAAPVALAAALALTACSAGASPDEDGAAVALCRAQLSAVGDLATTVRDEGDGWVVQAWAPGPPSGDPDHVCRVARDDTAERGVRLVGITPSPGPR